MVDTSESLFYTGESSKTVIKVNVPDGVESARVIAGRELVFNISNSAGYSDMVFFSRVNLTTGANCQVSCMIEGLSSSGVRSLKLTALNETVKIEQV